METAPVKSQPLHNFSLPFLKWGHKNHTNNNHRFRRPSDSAPRNSPSSRPPPSTAEYYNSLQSEPDSEPESDNRYRPAIGSRTGRNRFSFLSCSLQKQQTAAVLERESDKGDAEREKTENGCDEGEGEESATKPWNLRPRRVVTKVAMEVGTASKNDRDGELQETGPTAPAIPVNEILPKSLRLRGFVEGHGLVRKEKRKFWISLSREEIEEDVYALTGSKPARRPKKRPRNIQKQLDNVFPGLYLVGVTADSYRVHDALR